MSKPIRVFWSHLTERFYATRHYKIDGDVVTVTGEKFDVTQDIASAIVNNEIEFARAERAEVRES